MKFLRVVPLAALVFAAACSDTQSEPTAALAAPDKPVFDNIELSSGTPVDAVSKIMALTVGGSAKSTTLYVDPTNGDGKEGCNLTGQKTLVVAVASSDPTKATVSPSSLTFESCGDVKTLTVTPVAQGSATISLSQTSNSTAGTFNLTPATFTANVAAAGNQNTAPLLSITGVTGGTAYNKGSVPTAMCQVTDAEDGNSSFAATLSAVTGTYASDGIGSQTASCSYTDGGGLPEAASVTYSIVDPSAPTISSSLVPSTPDGANGWYKSTVVLTWTVTESESPNSLQKTGCANQTISADQQETTYSCSATSAGGAATQVDVKVKRDATAPSAGYTLDPASPNGTNGWYTSNVTVRFSGNDATSDIASCTDAVVLSTEGTGLSASGTCTDNAGNQSALATSSAVKIDKTAPTSISFVGSISNGDSYYFGSVPAAPTCTATDATSELASCVVTGHSTAVGSHILTATATDNAGNTSRASATYTVLAWTLNGFYQPVNMTALNTVKGGSTVPLKFEVFAGATELTDVASTVATFKVATVSCSDAATIGAEDPIDQFSTGGTSLRYDSTSGQFIQNWQTPKTVGTCYRVTMTTKDGSPISALFKTK